MPRRRSRSPSPATAMRRTNNGDGTWTLPGSARSSRRWWRASIRCRRSPPIRPGTSAATARPAELTVNPLAVAQAPAGSLVYSAPISGNLSSPGLTERFHGNTPGRRDGQPGRRLPSATLEPTATVCGPGGATLGSAAAAMLGSSVLVQTVAAAASGDLHPPHRRGGLDHRDLHGQLRAQRGHRERIARRRRRRYVGRLRKTSRQLHFPGKRRCRPRGAVLGSLAGSRDLLVNGGFETGTFSGWTASTSGGSQLTPWTVAPCPRRLLLQLAARKRQLQCPERLRRHRRPDVSALPGRDNSGRSHERQSHRARPHRLFGQRHGHAKPHLPDYRSVTRPITFCKRSTRSRFPRACGHDRPRLANADLQSLGLCRPHGAGLLLRRRFRKATPARPCSNSTTSA